MKRDKVTYPKVKLYKSYFFWEESRFCHKEFRKEQGFKIVDYKACKYGEENPFFTSYCCSDCASSMDKVKEKIHEGEKDFLNNKPRNPYKNDKEFGKKVYDSLIDLYKDEYKWNNIKEIYKNQSTNSKDIKEKALSSIALLVMNKFEKLKEGEI
jgi:hypothetical protein